MKKHLLEGVKKGAFDEAAAEEKFQKWLKEKENAIQAKKDKLASNLSEDKKSRLKAEAKINEARLAEIAKKNAEAAAKLAEEKKSEEAESTETPESSNTEA
jgi:small subunit ribosomal protein S16